MPVQSSWNAFSAFQVFGDHVPMEGFSLVVRIAADPGAVEQLLVSRAHTQATLDPDLAVMMMRAGIGLARSRAASFVYVNPDEAVVVLRPEAVSELGQSLVVHDHLIASWSARMALLSGISLPVSGQVYEFPDLGVVRKAIRSAIDSHEQGTPARSAWRLGAQMRGRGEPFHASMVETLEEQSELLLEQGIKIDSLPGWWWRGIAGKAASVQEPDNVQIWSELPSDDQLAELIA